MLPFKNFIANLFFLPKLFVKAYKLVVDYEKNAFQIKEIDLENNHVVLYYRGARVFLKTSLEKVVADATIIDELSPFQACYLGYSYGKILRKGKITASKLSSKSSLSTTLKSSKKRYDMISFDHRELKITYIDHQDNAIKTEPIAKLIHDKNFLSNISPSQACYIGIWAGVAVAKRGPGILVSGDSRDHLRVVK